MKVIFNDMDWKYKMLFGLDTGNRRLFHSLIDTTLMRMKYMDQIESTVGSDRVLKLDFEGLVKNYDVYKTIIENFIGLSPTDHVRKGEYFKPEESVSTINKYNHILDSSDYAKLAPLKEWYEQNMSVMKEKYSV
jgi:CRISPR/Cas system-associated protein Csm6